MGSGTRVHSDHNESVRPDRGRGGCAVTQALDAIADAVISLRPVVENLERAKLRRLAQMVRETLEETEREFMLAWEAMLRAEGRYSDNPNARRVQHLSARLYLGDV